MTKRPFKTAHINANSDDVKGNDGIGRYIFLPGSPARAEQIANHFDKLTAKSHARGHNFYTGVLNCDGKEIDVAATHSGIGCASAEIILHELFQLGAKRFLRVGTAGTLQPNIAIGDFINAQAAVRDESTSIDYVPLEFPAIASLEFASSIMLAAEKIKLAPRLHTGVVHCKSSLYAREFSAGPRATTNNAYIELLSNSGVLATEMETSTLFIQSQIYDHELKMKGNSPANRVLCGAILSVIASPKGGFEPSEKKIVSTIEEAVLLALETIKILASQEMH